jgi:hypothetical protein
VPSREALACSGEDTTMIGSAALLAACAVGGLGDDDVVSTDVTHPHPALGTRAS